MLESKFNFTQFLINKKDISSPSKKKKRKDISSIKKGKKNTKDISIEASLTNWIGMYSVRFLKEKKSLLFLLLINCTWL